jgi:hypothetical protein
LYDCLLTIILLENVFLSGLRHFLAALVRIQKEARRLIRIKHIVGLEASHVEVRLVQNSATKANWEM